ADASCRRRTPDLAASLHSAFEHVPHRWWFLPIKPGNVKAAAFFGQMNATAEGAGPLPAPKTIDTLLAIDDGRASRAWFPALVAQLAFPDAQGWGHVPAVGPSDAPYARRLFAAHE